MAGWRIHKGRAVWLDLDNIDTDQLIPARFMSVPRSEGYGDYLLHDLRRDAGGALLGDFPLNAAPGASVLLAGRNFGSGSSREAAVYALVDAGFRAVIAPRFGDIFAANAVNNGLLPAKVEPADFARLAAAVAQGDPEIAISLDDLELRGGDVAIPFDLERSQILKLKNGWDDIDLTLQHRDEIAAFKASRGATYAWARPAGPRGDKEEPHDKA